MNKIGTNLSTHCAQGVVILLEILPLLDYIIHMWTHFFTLQALAREVDSSLRSSTILEAFTQHKGELIISSVDANGVDRSLVISVEPSFTFMLLRNRTPRARKNSVDIFPDILHTNISHVAPHPTERIIFIRLNTGISLAARLFGTAQNNVFLLNEEGIIVGAFKKKDGVGGKALTETDRGNVPSSLPEFIARFRQHNGADSYSALKSCVPLFGSTYSREVLHRAGIPEARPVEQLPKEDLEQLFSFTQRIVDDVRKPRPTVYFRNDQPRVFSVIPLQHLSGARSVSFSSVNEAIRSTVFQSLKTASLEKGIDHLIRKIKTEHERTRRSLAAAQRELLRPDAGMRYERTANIIMANLQHLTKGTKYVDIEDIFSEKGSTVRLELDPKLTPAQNAERYYADAKKARAAYGEIASRIEELQKKFTTMEKLLIHLERCTTKEQLDEFFKEHAEVLKRWKIESRRKEEERPPFRMFTVAEDLEVWVGKSGTNNDLLTMQYARPNDIWFHVRGGSGSHVVLRLGNRKTEPSKEAITQTARIAAYYSKQRNASTVPVAYCQRKFIRKPRGAEPGTVIMEREKVVFVEPHLPEKAR
jgi:predicted ribosome quality control (RQC) complex YloA/Tae2 family protein